MLSAFAYRFILCKLQRVREKTRIGHRKELEQARKDKVPSDEINAMYAQHNAISDYIDDDILLAQQKLLTAQAEKYLIPIPEFSGTEGTWERSEISRRWHWSPATTQEMKNSIRQEAKDRRETWQSWIVLVTGLLGALIGVLSFVL